MKIAITGSSGHIGSELKKVFSREHEVVTLGRRNSDLIWTLGAYTDDLEIAEVDAILHLAWSTRDRAGDFDLNVGGTIRLAQFAHTNKIPFLFFSSVAALSNSHYGNSKKAAEISIQDFDSYILRIGLVKEFSYINKYKSRFFGISPNLKSHVYLTEMKDLLKFVSEWVENTDKTKHMKLSTVVTSKMNAKEFFFEHKLLRICVSDWAINAGLWILSPFSLRARNLMDAYMSLKTTRLN